VDNFDIWGRSKGALGSLAIDLLFLFQLFLLTFLYSFSFSNGSIVRDSLDVMSFFGSIGLGLDVFAEISEFERFMADKTEETYQLITRDVQEQLDAEAARLAKKLLTTAATADGTLFSDFFGSKPRRETSATNYL